VANKSFWEWIKYLKSQGIRSSSSTDEIENLLHTVSEDEKASLRKEYSSLMGDADTLLLWEACSLVSGRPQSDDSFEYFRNWILFGGEEFYLASVATPDSLEELCRKNGRSLESPFFEGLSVLGQELSLSSIPEGPLTQEFFHKREWNWADSSDLQIAEHLPKLWNIWGSSFRWEAETDQSDTTASFEAPGLGVIRVGDRVRHKFGLGEGVVVEILVADAALAKIQFPAEEKPFRITSAHFELTDRSAASQ
jgi:hypothetical protein